MSLSVENIHVTKRIFDSSVNGFVEIGTETRKGLKRFLVCKGCLSATVSLRPLLAKPRSRRSFCGSSVRF